MEKPTYTIELTKAQQLEVLAATGLRVKRLEVVADAAAEDGSITAELPLPKWLTETTGAR